MTALAINPELKTIWLHGRIAKEFGKVHRLAVATPREAIRAMSVLYPNFRQSIAKGSWQVIRGPVKKGLKLDIDSLGIGLGKADLHIVPAPIGSGRGGGKIILGVALVAVAVISAGTAVGFEGGFMAAMSSTAFMGVSYGSIALMGASMMLSGIAGLVAPAPATNIGATAAAQTPSYTLSGAQNTAVEGVCVPVVYGHVLVGSVLGASSMTTVDFGTSSPSPNTPAGAKDATEYAFTV